MIDNVVLIIRLDKVGISYASQECWHLPLKDKIERNKQWIKTLT